MYGHSPSAKIADPQDAAYDIPAEVVEDQDLPNGLAILVQYRRRLVSEAIGVGCVVSRDAILILSVIEVEDLFDECCDRN